MAVHFVDLYNFVTWLGPSILWTGFDPWWGPSTLWTYKLDPSWVRPFYGLILTLGGVHPLCRIFCGFCDHGCVRPFYGPVMTLGGVRPLCGLVKV